MSIAWFAGVRFRFSQFHLFQGSSEGRQSLEWTHVNLRTKDDEALAVGSEGALWVLWGGWCFEYPHARIVDSTPAGTERRLRFMHPAGARRARLVHVCGTLVALPNGRACRGCGGILEPLELLPPRLRAERRAWALGVLGDATAVGSDWFEVLLDAAEDGRPVAALRELVATDYKLAARPTLRDVIPSVRAVIERRPGERSASLVELVARRTIARSRRRPSRGISNMDQAFSHQLRRVRPESSKHCTSCWDRCGRLRHDGTHAVAEVCGCTSLWPDVFEFEVA